MDKLNPIQPESVEIRMLAQLAEYQRKIVQNRVGVSNCITATLKNYYPKSLIGIKKKT